QDFQVRTNFHDDHYRKQEQIAASSVASQDRFKQHVELLKTHPQIRYVSVTARCENWTVSINAEGIRASVFVKPPDNTSADQAVARADVMVRHFPPLDPSEIALGELSASEKEKLKFQEMVLQQLQTSTAQLQRTATEQITSQQE